MTGILGKTTCLAVQNKSTKRALENVQYQVQWKAGIGRARQRQHPSFSHLGQVYESQAMSKDKVQWIGQAQTCGQTTVYLTGLFASVMLQLKIERDRGMGRARVRGSSCNPQSSICKSERSKAFNWQIVLRRQKAKRDKEWWRKRGKEKSYQKGQHKHPHRHTHTYQAQNAIRCFSCFLPTIRAYQCFVLSSNFFPLAARTDKQITTTG